MQADCTLLIELDYHIELTLWTAGHEARVGGFLQNSAQPHEVPLGHYNGLYTTKGHASLIVNNIPVAEQTLVDSPCWVQQYEHLV